MARAMVEEVAIWVAKARATRKETEVSARAMAKFMARVMARTIGHKNTTSHPMLSHPVPRTR
jgi:hypothetical protein